MENTSTLEQKRGTLLRTAQSIVDRALREGRALRPAEETDLAGLEEKISAADRTLNRFSLFNRTGGEPGTVFARAVLALAGAAGNRELALERADVTKDHELYRALSAAIGTQGGFAVPMGYSGEIIESLRPLVAVRKLNPVVVPMTTATLTWPRISTPGNAAFIGENNPVSLSQAQTFAQLRLSLKKLPALIPISNDFIRQARPTGDAIVKDDIVASLASIQDGAFITGTGFNDTPKGLINWCLTANQIASNSTISPANTDSDLAQLELALANANVRGLRLGWLFSPQTETYLRSLRNATSGIRFYPEMDGGYLRGKPFAATTNCPSSTVILADFADVVVGDAEIVIAAGRNPTYTDANGNVISAFAQDQTVVKAILQSDIGVRHPESVAMLTGVNWVPAAA